MKILISSWETKNLRVPDMQVVLKDNLNFIQIPNGGGKTTIQQLIKGVLTNSLSQFKKGSKNPNGLLDLADKNDFQKKGEFNLELEIINGPDGDENIYFENIFDFDKDSITSYTTSASLGRQAGWKPPAELASFMNEEHANVFIFTGDKLDSYFDSDPNRGTPVRDAIETFSGIKAVKNTLKKVEENFNVKNSSKVKKSDKTIDKKIQGIRRVIAVLKNLKQADESNLKSIRENWSKLNKKVESLGDGDLSNINLKEEYAEKINTIKVQINEKESLLNSLLINPFNISKKTSKLSQAFRAKLEKLKLPGYASEFFTELVESGDECICGEKLDKNRKDRILANSENYLSTDEVDHVYKIKQQIQSESEDASEKSVKDLIEDLKILNNDLQTQTQHLERIKRKTNQAALTKEEIKRYDRLGDDKKIIEQKIAKYDSQKFSLTRLKKLTIEEIKTIETIFDAQNLLSFYELEAAEAGGYAKDLRKKNDFIDAVNIALVQSYEQVCLEIKDEVNLKIQKSHHDETFKIEKIDEKINIFGSSEGGSGGQNVIAVTSFASTLLDKSNAFFPLLIDHPVTALQYDSRGEISKMLSDIGSQVICLVIDSEKPCFITERDHTTFLPVAEKSNLITISRLDRGVTIDIPIPEDALTQKSKNGLVSTNKKFFTDFKIMEQD